MSKRKYEDLPHIKKVIRSLKKLAKEKGLEVLDTDMYEEHGYRWLAFFKTREDFSMRFHVLVTLPYLYEDFDTIGKQTYGTIFKVHKTIKKLKPFIN